MGDALGYDVEFCFSLSEIRERHGSAGIQEPALNDIGKAVVSDDTQMTLFTAQGILESLDPSGRLDRADVLASVREATLDWYALQTGRPQALRQPHGIARYAVLAQSRHPGNTCRGACAAGAAGTPERPITDSKGCGGVMRVAPVGLIRDLSPEEAFHLAARCAAQTHGHPSGHLSAGVLAALMRALVDSDDVHAAVADALALAGSWDGARDTVAAVEQALRLASEHRDDHHGAIIQLGKGWCGDEALAIGVYAALSASDYRDAVRIASNHGGDSDSTASIAGQIHGAWKGLDGIPNAWIRRLDAFEPLLEVVGRMVRRSS